MRGDTALHTCDPKEAVVTEEARLRPPAGRKGRTHGRKSEEGDTDEGVKVAARSLRSRVWGYLSHGNGCQGDL